MHHLKNDNDVISQTSPILCTDTNECVRFPGICKNGGTCVNAEGSYQCECGQGWGGQHCEQGKIRRVWLIT